jgi:hypothetical protein
MKQETPRNDVLATPAHTGVVARCSSHALCEKEVFEGGKCIFHCPKDDWFEVVKNEKGEEEKDWSKSEEKVGQFWREIREKIKREERDVHCKVHNFSHFVFPKCTENAFFEASEKRKFKKRTYFRNAKFFGMADLFDIDFSEDVCFSLATFSEEANFWKTTFSGEANFIYATFSKQGKGVFLLHNLLWKSRFLLHNLLWSGGFLRHNLFRHTPYIV